MADDTIDEMDDDFDVSLEDSPENTGHGQKDPSGKAAWLTKIRQMPRMMFKSRKAVILASAVFLVVLGGAAVAWLFFGSSGTKEAANAPVRTGTMAPETVGVPEKEDAIFEDIIDLASFERLQLKSNSHMSLISLNLSMELTDPRFRRQIYTMEDRIRKIIIDQVGELTWLELRSPEGKLMLKYSLLKRINSIFPKATVRNIYFTFFLMQ